MKIWIMNHYAAHMRTDKGGRHYWFAKYLDKMGYQPVVFCAYKEQEKLWEKKMAEDIHTPFINVKVHGTRDGGLTRIINMVSFYFNVKKAAIQFAKTDGRPDIILASSVHPLTLIAGEQLAKRYGVPCICEMRDLWPEAIVAYSKKIKKDSLLAKMLYAGEKWIYTRADALIFTQEGGPDYIREKGWDSEHGGPIDLKKAYHINNGVDLEAFDKNLKEFYYEDEDMDDSDTFKVVYAGAIRRINNLGLIVDAAKLVKDPKIRFVIFGHGDPLEPLKQRLVEEDIHNVVFKGRVNKQYIPSIDARADVNLVHWEMNPLLRVGESYNKSFEYFAAGKPVFYTVRPGYSIVEKYKCGLLTEGFTPQDIANGIEKIAAMSDKEKKTMAKNARKVAEIYDFKNHTKKLVEIINKCLEEKRDGKNRD
ncbi:MAG: glycosyltransferase family 4 protein [Erysipelotrichaceae bacterium]|nr:glycosyltransferase family 4 protein [Erysipelotrichaceae bacterium]